MRSDICLDNVKLAGRKCDMTPITAPQVVGDRLVSSVLSQDYYITLTAPRPLLPAAALCSVLARFVNPFTADPVKALHFAILV